MFSWLETWAKPLDALAKKNGWKLEHHPEITDHLIRTPGSKRVPWPGSEKQVVQFQMPNDVLRVFVRLVKREKMERTIKAGRRPVIFPNIILNSPASKHVCFNNMYLLHCIRL